jgi:Nucleotide-diphospho-sugar transferase
MIPPVERAVYFLGNDRVLNYGIAAFESFRDSNPDLPAFLLPFNDDLARTRELARVYSLQIVDDSRLKILHETAEEFWDEKHRDQAMFKKFFAFFGPARRFLFSDCDVVFLQSLDSLFDKFDKAQLDFLSFDPSMDYVYNPGSFRDQLVRENRTRGFNAGVFMSRNGLTSLEQIQAFFREHKPMRREFHDTRDQSMINYFVDTLGWRHQNLAELDPFYCESNNGRHAPIREVNGHYALHNPYSPYNGKRFYMLHWNGLKLPSILPNMSWFYRYRLKRTPWPSRITYMMKNTWAGRAILWRSLADKTEIFFHRLKRRCGLA